MTIVHEWPVLDTARVVLDAGYTQEVALRCAVDLAPPVFRCASAPSDTDGIVVESAGFCRTEFLPEPMRVSAWQLEGRAVGLGFIMKAGQDLVLRVRNDSEERRELVFELRPPEKVAQLGDGMEGVLIIAGDICPKCGLPGLRSSQIESAFPDFDPMFVHQYTRVKRERDFEISSHGGCRLEENT